MPADDTEQERIQQRIAQFERDEIEAVAHAMQPDATPEELRRLFEQREQRRAEGQTLIQRNGNPVQYWEGVNGLAGPLSSHPNTPLDILQKTIIWGEDGMAGFLRNPILPFLFLESPDFLTGVSHSHWTLPELLRRPDLPLPLLHALSAYEDPWIALEAQMHISMPDSEPLNLNRLDQRVLDILSQAKVEDRIHYRELADLGFLPDELHQPPAWEDAELQVRLAAIPDDFVEQTVQEARTRTLWSSRRRIDWLYGICEANINPRLDETTQKLFQIRVSLHPDVPAWVMTAFRGWVLLDKFSPEDVLRLRCLVKRCPRLSARAFDRHRRQRTIQTTFPRGMACPGLPYLIARKAGTQPGRRATKTAILSAPYSGIPWRRFAGDCVYFNFLQRLSIALHLDVIEGLKPPKYRKLQTFLKIPYHEFEVPLDLRERLQNDSNRYVRAVARGSLTIPRRWL